MNAFKTAALTGRFPETIGDARVMLITLQRKDEGGFIGVALVKRNANRIRPFVTGIVTQDTLDAGEWALGHYFETYADAWLDYEARVRSLNA